MLRICVIFARDGTNPLEGLEKYMKLPAAAGNFIYISEIYMKMPATAGIFIYISEASEGFEPSRAKSYKI